MFGMVENHICEAILEIKKDTNAKAKFEKMDTLIANQVLFAFIKSYIFEDQFDHAVLHVNSENGHFSYIEIPEMNDPLESSFQIRPKCKLNVLSHMYEFNDYYEHTPWSRGGRDFDSYSRITLSDSAVVVMERMISKYDIYRKAFSSDSDEMRLNLDLLKKIEYVRLTGECTDELIEMCATSERCNYGAIKHLFGHRYFSGNDNANYIVAKNWIGPVGLICLFDQNRGMYEDGNKNAWSISYVSVSTCYRKLGIASRMLKESFQWASENNKYICRTEPSEIGRKYTFDKFSKIAKESFPKIPFVENEYKKIAHIVSKFCAENGLSFQKECHVLNALLIKARELENSITKRPFYGDDEIINSIEFSEYMRKILSLNTKTVESNNDSAIRGEF